MGSGRISRTTTTPTKTKTTKTIPDSLSCDVVWGVHSPPRASLLRNKFDLFELEFAAKMFVDDAKLAERCSLMLMLRDSL